MAQCDTIAPTGLATPTRNRYFYGKLLDSTHLTLEQDYVNSKRWMLNRLGLGWGVLCGLPVAPTSNRQGVVVGVGVAIDRFGREIVVPVPSAAVDFRKLTDECGRPTGEVASAGSIVTLCLSYAECLTEYVPTTTTNCDGQPDCAASSVQERYRLIVTATPPEVTDLSCTTAGLWQPASLATEFVLQRPLGLDAATLTQRVTQACPQPADAQPPSGWVPLAIITVPAEGQAVTDQAIDQSVRPVVYGNELLAEMMRCLAEQVLTTTPGIDIAPPPAPHPLTTITEANWLSQGPTVIDMSTIDFYKGLTVDFSGPVIAPSGPGQGWFLVTFEALQATRESTHLEAKRVRSEEIKFPEPTRAVFVPHPDTSGLIDTLGLPLLCRVIIKCGVILDEMGNAVDGNYLASMPTGDGVVGGDFESWFILDK